MALGNVTFTYVDGGLPSGALSDDGISGLLYVGATADTGTLAGPVRLTSNDTSAFGTLPPELQAHIDEFFRMAPGRELWVMEEKLDDPLSAPGALKALLITLAQAANGTIKQYAITGPKLPVLYTAIQTDVSAFATYLESLTWDAVILTDETSLTTKFVTGTGPMTNTSPTRSALYKCMGLVLGTVNDVIDGPLSEIGTVKGKLAGRPVGANIGQCSDENSVQTAATYKDISVSSGAYNAFTPTELGVLDQFGIFARKVSAEPGLWFNDDPSLGAPDSSYRKLSWMKAAQKFKRGVFRKLRPEINANVVVDPATGFIDKVVVRHYAGLIAQVGEQMKKDGEISGYGFSMDPNQDILTQGQLNLELEIVPILHSKIIAPTIRLTLKLSV